MMRRFFGWMLLAFLTGPAMAQVTPTPGGLAAAQELTDIISKDTVQQLAARLTQQVWPQVGGMIKSKNPTISDAVLADLQTDFQSIQAQFLSDVMKDAPAIYARYFTEEELRQLIDFYHSPIGIKAIRTLPQVTTEAMSLVLPKLPQVQAQVQSAFTKRLRDRGFDP